MICEIQDVLIGSKTVVEFTDKNTGEIRHYYRVSLLQDDSEPMEFSVEDDIFENLEKLSSYDLKLNVSNFKGKLYFKIVGVSRCHGGVAVA